MRRLELLLLLAVAVHVRAQEAPTELYDCVDDADGPAFCSDSTAVLVDEGCGSSFSRYHGRIAWPVLKNVGPVIISVKTRYVEFGRTHIPLYVEVRGRTTPSDQKECRTGLGGHLVLVAQGGPDCGGAWASVGPINLRDFGVPMDESYIVQVVFFESLPDDNGELFFHSVGFSCLRVTSHPTAVASTNWSNVKVLYQ